MILQKFTSSIDDTDANHEELMLYEEADEDNESSNASNAASSCTSLSSLAHGVHRGREHFYKASIEAEQWRPRRLTPAFDGVRSNGGTFSSFSPMDVLSHAANVASYRRY